MDLCFGEDIFSGRGNLLEGFRQHFEGLATIVEDEKNLTINAILMSY